MAQLHDQARVEKVAGYGLCILIDYGPYEVANVDITKIENIINKG